MVRIPKRINGSLQVLIEEVYRSGRMSRQVYLLMTATLLSGQKVSPEERQQIIRVLDSLKLGRLSMIN
ncbi:hypothetical protein [Alkalinema sp. FACHB-956]|uniref:hypothetical protein n=1 Tax=Alkalinema sp. FACHB-956 TaxID=2692768 RepID=UPI001684A988|nr:hypothetical protein [Alkalinema sp. FACHB-956]MBD2328897.1 hypothetical protein [Alkalinema sp. FACHB-956]